MDVGVITLAAEVSIDEYVKNCVDVERFLACCSECRGYGKTWACPPYDFDPMELWMSYDSLLLYAKKVILPEEETAKERTHEELAAAYRELLEPVKRELLDELYEMERKHPGSMALSAGGCDVCESCTRPDGLPCRAPDNKRYSVESIGGNVLKSIEEIWGEEILWAQDGHLPRHFILLGGLLKKK